MIYKFWVSTSFLSILFCLAANQSIFAQTEYRIIASDGATEDAFGVSVSIDGDLVIVGSVGDDDNGSSSGSVYVFRFDGSTWNEEQKLTASDGDAQDRFGVAVSISGNRIIVGAIWDNDNGVDSGSAYIYRYDGSRWIEEQKLTASDGKLRDQFGFSVSISGGLTIVGMVYEVFQPENPADSGSA